jgi:SAM-dependent methyltransferase
MSPENTPPMSRGGAGPGGAPVDLEQVGCNLCGGRSTALLYRGFEHRYFDDENEWPVVRCRDCGLAFVNPRPTAASMGRYYPSGYDAHRDSSGEHGRYEYQLSFLDGFAPGRILDVGCARGDWLVLAKRRGWEVTGVEPGGADKNPHDLPLYSSHFPDAGLFSPSSFEVVTSWAVFEHLHDPLAAFRRVEELLAPGGTFFAMVPNVDSIASRWAYVEDLPRHLYFFSRATLGAYGRKVGLDLRRIEQCPQFFGGLGKGFLRVRAFGRTPAERRAWFRFIQEPRSARFRASPVKAAVDLACAAIESAALRPSLIRRLGWSGHVVAVFRKPPRA